MSTGSEPARAGADQGNARPLTGAQAATAPPTPPTPPARTGAQPSPAASRPSAAGSKRALNSLHRIGDLGDVLSGSNGGASRVLGKYLPIRPAHRLYRAAEMLRQQGCDQLADQYEAAADQLVAQLAITC